MVYLLDTNACIDYLTGRYPAVIARIQRSSPHELRLSTVVVAELRYGADKSARPKANHSRLDALVEEIECLVFDQPAAAAYGRMRTRLEAAGTPIGPNDMLIAAHALSRNLVLVTNILEFKRVKGLKIQNWRRRGGETPGPG
jgi:tRNA(fMet)-specific endonuclease VapC